MTLRFLLIANFDEEFQTSMSFNALNKLERFFAGKHLQPNCRVEQQEVLS